jgi:hypothetical protein
MAHSASAHPRWGGNGGRAARAATETLAFACELAMVVILGIAGWSLGSGGLLSIALTIFYPALAILVWAVWVAPKAGRRLGDPWRLGIQLALFAGTAALSGAGGHILLAVVFGAVAWLTFIGARFTGGSTGAGPADDGLDEHFGTDPTGIAGDGAQAGSSDVGE